MLNLDEVLGAARRLPDIGITHRRTTISTVGWLPGLKRFADEVPEPIRLALGHHPHPPRRGVTECVRHAIETTRRVFVEYVMLAGVNDSPEQARALGALLG